MAEGRKGAGPYSKNYADFDRPADDGYKTAKSIAEKVGIDFKTDWSLNEPQLDGNWKPGPLPRGGEPKYSPKGDSGTHQRGPSDMTNSAGSDIKPSGKYAKKGGTGKGFGS